MHISIGIKGIAIAAIFNLATVAAASTTVFSSQGLDFEINDDDPLAPTITFLSGQTFSDSYFIENDTLSDSVFTGSTTIQQPFPDPPIVVDDYDDITVTLTSVSTTGPLTSNPGPSSLLTFVDTDTYAFADTFSDPDESLLISGIYTIEGDTETVTGSFDFVYDAIAIGPTRLNTSMFPDAVSLDRPLSVAFPALGPFQGISTTVDGESFRFSFQIRINDGGVSINPIPVPPAVYLLISGLLVLARVGRSTAA